MSVPAPDEQLPLFANADVPPYSTTDTAADVVVRSLASAPRRWMCVQAGKDWTFHWRRPLTETDLALTTSGTLTIRDVDSPQTFVAQTGSAGANGTFAIDAAGVWTYTANSPSTA